MVFSEAYPTTAGVASTWENNIFYAAAESPEKLCTDTCTKNSSENSAMVSQSY